MKKNILIACMLLCGIGGADERFRTKLAVDLNGDGRPDTIRLITYKANDVTLGQLVVEDAGGKLLWKGPRFSDAYASDPYRFLGEFDRGDLEFAGDLDGDGRVELVATYQKSDVRPTEFRMFRWNGKRFVFEQRGMLVPQPQKPATFNFSKADPARTYWVDEIRKAGGHYRLKIMDLRTQKSSTETANWVKGQGFILSTSAR